jgi:phosphate transport system permease protein
MSSTALAFLVLGLGVVAWLTARGKALAVAKVAGVRPHPLPGYHGWYVALWAVVPALLFLAVWSSVSGGLVTGAVLADPVAVDLPASPMQRGAILAEARDLRKGAPRCRSTRRPRQLVPAYRDAASHYGLIGGSGRVAARLCVRGAGLHQGVAELSRADPGRTPRHGGAAARVADRGADDARHRACRCCSSPARFFALVSPIEFLFGTTWSPQTAIRADQAGSSGAFGAIPLFWGTVFIGAIIAMIIAIPLGLMSAIYLTQYATPGTRRVMKPLLEILAGVPTVVYGYFAALTIAPAVRSFGLSLGIPSSSNPRSPAGLVMGIMIIPFISSMADDSINAVPQAMRDGSLAMGATTSETITKVLVPGRPFRVSSVACCWPSAARSARR